MRRWVLWLPLALLALFLGLAGYQLTQPKQQFVASTMIGKSLPAIDLKPAREGEDRLTLKDFQDGQPRLLNIWGSWCAPCIAEAPHLETLRQQGVQIIGVAIRDLPENVADFLERHGNPYAKVGLDDLSAIQFEIGSSGVPETFVIDGDGVIRHQHIGEVRARDVPILLEKLREAAQ